ncbi:MAG: LL-diaminopimelate aminotransferase [Spirochaetes bacterium]|nr:LL-diaminopimelate aminotransferase [Spirochaetota bacterium]
MDSYIQSLFSERIGGIKFGKDTTIYKFEKIKRAKREAVKNHPDIPLIDAGVGEPDEGAFAGVVQKLSEEAGKRENRYYSDNGINEFKQAAASYMQRVFGVTLDPDTEIIHGIGSKPVLAMLPLTLINPGDVSILTVPGYPVLGTHTKYLGGEVFNLPLTKANNFLPDLKSIPADIAKRAKILLLNYPNNPTGRNATVEFYKEVIDFAKKNNVIVVQDAAYAALTFTGKPLSFLSVPGAKDVGIEIHSMSKAFNMTGWRLAFVCGNPLLISAYGTVKDNIDSGQFMAIQKAGIYALEHTEMTEAIVTKYKRRMKKFTALLSKLGFKAEMPDGTFYLYVEAPKGTASGKTFATAEDFSQFLIREKLISSVPWDDVGHFIRFTVTFVADGEAEEDRILGEIEKRLSSEKYIF